MEIIIILLLLILSFRELSFGILLISKRAQVWKSPADVFDRLRAHGRKPCQIYICDRLLGQSLGWKTLYGEVLFVDRAWWEILNIEQKQAVIFWFAVSNLRQPSLLRILGLQNPFTIDRDCILWGISSTSLISVLESLHQKSGKRLLSLLETGLLGFSMYGSIQNYGSTSIQSRIESLLRQSQRLHESS